MEPQRLILSRKGFDSSAGGVPSPIFPDGSFVSLPIPLSNAPLSYNDVRWNGLSLGDIVRDLGRGTCSPSDACHLDPDLDPLARSRRPGWRPLFGQVGSAQAHLSKQRVGPGDLFLFFGWFRRVERVGGRLRFIPKARDVHLIFGWLQVDEMIPVTPSRNEEMPWADEHPHLNGDWPQNTIYTSRRHLSIGGRSIDCPGAGIFPAMRESLQLTMPGQTRSTWRLPAWMYPTDGRPPLSFHKAAKRWKIEDNHAVLNAAGRGQEFVLDLSSYPESQSWLTELFGAVLPS